MKSKRYFRKSRRHRKQKSYQHRSRLPSLRTPNSLLHRFNPLGNAKTIHWRLRNNKHEQNIQSSQRVLEKIKSFEFRSMFAYLRKIDPYLFEEVVLTALNEQGYRIQRNASYSKDGGFDGMVYIEGSTYMIQAKKYVSFVKTEHIKSFEQLVENTSNVQGGLFVHTGKTPTSGKFFALRSKKIAIISGYLLVQLIHGNFDKVWNSLNKSD